MSAVTRLQRINQKRREEEARKKAEYNKPHPRGHKITGTHGFPISPTTGRKRNTFEVKGYLKNKDEVADAKAYGQVGVRQTKRSVHSQQDPKWLKFNVDNLTKKEKREKPAHKPERAPKPKKEKQPRATGWKKVGQASTSPWEHKDMLLIQTRGPGGMIKRESRSYFPRETTKAIAYLKNQPETIQIMVRRQTERSSVVWRREGE